MSILPLPAINNLSPTQKKYIISRASKAAHELTWCDVFHLEGHYDYIDRINVTFSKLQDGDMSMNLIYHAHGMYSSVSLARSYEYTSNDDGTYTYTVEIHPLWSPARGLNELEMQTDWDEWKKRGTSDLQFPLFYLRHAPSLRTSPPEVLSLKHQIPYGLLLVWHNGTHRTDVSMSTDFVSLEIDTHSYHNDPRYDELVQNDIRCERTWNLHNQQVVLNQKYISVHP
jgi:hypothetical protein